MGKSKKTRAHDLSGWPVDITFCTKTTRTIASHLKPEDVPVNISTTRTPDTEFKDKMVIELGMGY